MTHVGRVVFHDGRDMEHDERVVFHDGRDMVHGNCLSHHLRWAMPDVLSMTNGGYHTTWFYHHCFDDQHGWSLHTD